MDNYSMDGGKEQGGMAHGGVSLRHLRPSTGIHLSATPRLPRLPSFCDPRPPPNPFNPFPKSVDSPPPRFPSFRDLKPGPEGPSQL